MLLKISKNKESSGYPHHVLEFDEIDLNAPVVFFTGNNGSGKSTLLKMIHTLADTIDIGNSMPLPQTMIDSILDTYHLSWRPKLRQGTYLQSEDFFAYLKWAEQEAVINQSFLDETNQRHDNHNSMAYLLESNLHKGNIAVSRSIVENFKNVSHGEGYLSFFSKRLKKESLYLLDEPETPLSFENQLALIKLMHDAVSQGSQFIICTHSPILLSYPQALIYNFDHQVKEVDYDDVDLVDSYRSFLKEPQRYLYHLLKKED